MSDVESAACLSWPDPSQNGAERGRPHEFTSTVALASQNIILMPNVLATTWQPSSVATDRQTDNKNELDYRFQACNLFLHCVVSFDKYSSQHTIQAKPTNQKGKYM